MFAQINHMAMTSPNWPMLGRFYEAAFGLKPSGKSRPLNGFTVGDGVVGLNINPQRDGYAGGLDHFGFLVEDVETVTARMREKYPDTEVVDRPSTRPFAAYSGHDPDGNVFDLAQRNQNTVSDVYAQQVDKSWQQERYLNKFAIRTPHPERCAEFYIDVFGLQPVNQNRVPGQHLTDGRVTLALLPWSIRLFKGMAIKRPGPEHIGVHVESIDALQADLRRVTAGNTYLTPVQLGGSKEADVRLQLFRSGCTGELQIADPAGTWIDVTAA